MHACPHPRLPARPPGCPPARPPACPSAGTHARTHAFTHAHTHPRTHARTHALSVGHAYSYTIHTRYIHGKCSVHSRTTYIEYILCTDYKYLNISCSEYRSINLKYNSVNILYPLQFTSCITKNYDSSCWNFSTNRNISTSHGLCSDINQFDSRNLVTHEIAAGDTTANNSNCFLPLLTDFQP